jgi:hypothetical protein
MGRDCLDRLLDLLLKEPGLLARDSLLEILLSTADGEKGYAQDWWVER